MNTHSLLLALAQPGSSVSVCRRIPSCRMTTAQCLWIPPSAGRECRISVGLTAIPQAF